MSIPTGKLKAKVSRRRKMKEEEPNQTYQKKNSTNENVKTMKASSKVETRTICPI